MTLVKDCIVGGFYLIKLNEQETTDPKPSICICIGICLFFVVHTKPMISDNLPIRKKDHVFLSYDSHIKCGVVLELDKKREVIKKMGIIATTPLAEMIEIVDYAEVLTPIEKRPILESLRNLQQARNTKP